MPHREAAAPPSPIFCSESSLAPNSEGGDVPKDTKRWRENDVNKIIRKRPIYRMSALGQAVPKSSSSPLILQTS